MDYSQLSDFEINRLVGDVIFKGCWACKPETSGNDTSKWYYGNADATFEPLPLLPDYCNDWSATGPIIESKLICLAADVFAEPHDGGKWVAQPAYGWEKERVRSNNPLRAAMIVFLMMQDAKNA